MGITIIDRRFGLSAVMVEVGLAGRMVDDWEGCMENDDADEGGSWDEMDDMERRLAKYAGIESGRGSRDIKFRFRGTTVPGLPSRDTNCSCGCSCSCCCCCCCRWCSVDCCNKEEDEGADSGHVN